LLGYEKSESGARKYYTMPSFQALCDVMQTPKPRYWHEYAFPDKPLKLFVDVDDKSKREDWDAFLTKLQAHVAEMVEHALPPRVWTAHTPDKLSAHLIWPDVWFDRPATLAAFAKRLYERLERDPRMDLAPYSANDVFKSLRTPYSCKRGKDGYPLLLEPHRNPAFDPALLLESLLTHGEPSRVITGDAPLMQFPTAKPDAAPHRLQALDRIAAWIQTFWGVRRIATCKPLQEDGTWVWRLNPGVWCEVQQRKHASNETMLRGKLVADALVRVELYCLDPQCCKWVVCNRCKWNKIAFLF
jgi:hypothetical protein